MRAQNPPFICTFGTQGPLKHKIMSFCKNICCQYLQNFLSRAFGARNSRVRSSFRFLGVSYCSTTFQILTNWGGSPSPSYANIKPLSNSTRLRFSFFLPRSYRPFAVAMLTIQHFESICTCTRSARMHFESFTSPKKNSPIVRGNAFRGGSSPKCMLGA